MGNYLTKLKELIISGLPTLERARAKKRKHHETEHDFETVLREEIEDETYNAPNSDQDGLTSPSTVDNEEISGDTDGSSTSVSLSQLNSIMNRINQPDLVLRNRNNLVRDAITPSDLESVLFSRNRIAYLQSNRNSISPKLIRSSPIQNSSSPRCSKSSSSGSARNTVDIKLETPARKKMKSTSDYIFTTLFLNGENSDLCITALNKQWRLHKIYLCQSPYFDSMFKSGSRWIESTQSSMEINIPDENINEKALSIAFGSFYKEEIEIMPLEVVNVLACASLFSLDGLIAKCAEIMIDNINYKSVIGFYEASLTYGVKSVTEKTLKWLSYNLMSNTDFVLADLKLSLLEEILETRDLLIIQVETDLYTTCKKWLYFQLNKPTNPPSKLDKNWQRSVNEFFKTLMANPDENEHLLTDLNDSGTHSGEASLVLDVGCTSFSNEPSCSKSIKRQHKQSLLDRPAFSKYIPLFKKIRLQHILTDMASLDVLYNDRIIPHEWIEPHFSRNWLYTIYIDQEPLSHEFEITPDDFDKQCARFGRILAEDSPATWRWVGFNYGIDLLISHTSRTLTLKRNTLHMYSPFKGLLSQKATYRVYYVMKIVQLDSFGTEKWSTQTSLTCVDLNRNEEKFVLTIDSTVKYPVLLNFRIVTHPCHAGTQNIIENLFD